MTPAKAIPKRRNGYYHIDGKEYVSVTKVMGDTLKQEWMFYWAIREAATRALANPYLDVAEIRSQIILNKTAAERGTAVHAAMEAWGETGRLGVIDKRYESWIGGCQEWIDAFQPVTIFNEVELFSDMYGVAGRCDWVGRLNGTDDVWLLDWKTGKGIYDEVTLQLSIYKHMMTERSIMDVDRIGVVLFTEDGKYTFREVKPNLQGYLDVKKVWEWKQSSNKFEV